MLSNDTARCEGHGAGPSGHQLRADCLHCQRRTAPRPAGQVWFLQPSPEFPCPNHIPASTCTKCGDSGWKPHRDGNGDRVWMPLMNDALPCECGALARKIAAEKAAQEVPHD